MVTPEHHDSAASNETLGKDYQLLPKPTRQYLMGTKVTTYSLYYF